MDHHGTDTYPRPATLITADSGGSNGSRLRLWKTELAALATEIGLEITVCHLRRAPPSGIRSNTDCSPRSAATGATTSELTRGCHRNHESNNHNDRAHRAAELDIGTYEKGIKISDKQIKTSKPLNYTVEFTGWNYR